MSVTESHVFEFERPLNCHTTRDSHSIECFPTLIPHLNGIFVVVLKFENSMWRKLMRPTHRRFEKKKASPPNAFEAGLSRMSTSLSTGGISIAHAEAFLNAV